MKSKIFKKMLILVGVLIAGSVAILPINSHAATSHETTVTLSIQPSINVSITNSNVNALRVDPGNTATAGFTVAVTSNTHYSLSLKSDTTASLVGTGDNSIAPAADFSDTKTGWAYKLSTGDWTTPSTGGSVLYSSNSGSFSGLGSENVGFTVGVGATNAVAAGEYSGSIIVTASAI